MESSTTTNEKWQTSCSGGFQPPLPDKSAEKMASRQPVVEMMDPMMVEIMRKKTPAEPQPVPTGAES